MDINEKLIERLYKNCTKVYNKNYSKPCLEVINVNKNSEYGRININGKLQMKHRVSYAISKNINIDDILKNDESGNFFDVCHGEGCSKRCIEPTHLELKTRSENNHNDKIRDGTLLRGEKNPGAKINEEIALKIKHSKGEGTQQDRAIKFGVSNRNIRSIDNGETWAHLPNIDGTISDTNKRRNNEKKYRNKSKEISFDNEDFNNILISIRSKCLESEDIQKNVETPCHIFQNYISNEGYGCIEYKKISYKTHILVYMAYNKLQEIESKNVIRHLCDIKNCCNPEHLKEGSRRENALDTLSYSKNCKLDEHKVRKINELLEQKHSCIKIAEIFGVTRSTIYAIKDGKTWSHVK
jgi:hypothetical protein